jgi:hypothetical protein
MSNVASKTGSSDFGGATLPMVVPASLCRNILLNPEELQNTTQRALRHARS